MSRYTLNDLLNMALMDEIRVRNARREYQF